MKKNVLRFLSFLICILGSGLLLLSCQAEEELSVWDNTVLNAELDCEWSVEEKNDTIFLIGSQTLSYVGENGRETLYPKAVAKLYFKSDTVLFAKGYDAVPKYEKKTLLSEGYIGVSPRRYVILKEISFSDGQILYAELSSDIYSCYRSGIEVLLPYVSLYDIAFDKVNVSSVDEGFSAQMSFNATWKKSNQSDSFSQSVEASYFKQRVDEVDKLLSTTYDSGINWVNDGEFELFVIRKEIWRIKGEQNDTFCSPKLDFFLNASENKTLKISQSAFSSKLSFEQDIKQDISQNGWNLKKGTAKQTVMFSNGETFFEDVFQYPLYEASYKLDNKVFEFDLSAKFSETNMFSYQSSGAFCNETYGKVLFAGKTFEQTALTILEFDAQAEEPTDKGKIKGFFVSAVFDPSEIKAGGAITKKCVLICHETGYEWGICAFEKDFPDEFIFSNSKFNGFNSAAKKSSEALFELARVSENDSNLLWYDADNKLISGIDALTAKIYGWKNIVNGKYASFISGYQAQISDDGLVMKLISPSGNSMSFKARSS